MTNPLLAAVGVRVCDEALSADLCRDLVDAMRAAATTEPATVFGEGFEPLLAENVRSTLWVSVPEVLAARASVAISATEPWLEEQFGGPLMRPDDFSFLRYGAGGRYIAHTDRPSDTKATDAPADLLARRISVVVFLNDQTETGADGSYAGGSLLFKVFGDDDTLGKHGFGTQQRRGTMVAFPADLMHEVTAVKAGEPFTIVGWYG